MWELSGAEIVIAGAEALELLGPAGEGARVGRDVELAQTSVAVVAVEQMPGLRGHFGEGVSGTQAGDFAVGGDDLAPESVFLHAVEEQARFGAVYEALMPEVCEPGFEGEDRRRRPGGFGEEFLLGVESSAQRARGALVGGEDRLSGVQGV